MDPFFELFPDRYPFVISEDSHFWRIGLKWPETEEWYVDPNLADQARKCFGYSLAELPTHWEERNLGKPAFVFSMFHSRALLAPAMALRKGHTARFSHIVHVDDHDDLMPPLLRRDVNALIDPIAQTIIDLHKIDSVNAAIDRGVISKGSFLAAYVLGSPLGSVIHVRENGFTTSFQIAVESIERRIGSAIIATSAPSKQIANSAGWRWQEAPLLPLSLDDCQSVWLDVDLDAFCNRYDGDSDRAHALGTESERAILRQRMDRFLDRLSNASWKSRVDAVSIALSPGFFPSEYWNEAIPKITNGVADIISGRR